jgi:hypothetical protein
MHENNGYESHLLLREYRARICKSFEEPRHRFPAWRAGTTTLFDVPDRSMNRFLGLLKNVYEYGSALASIALKSMQRSQIYRAKNFAALTNLQS